MRARRAARTAIASAAGLACAALACTLGASDRPLAAGQPVRDASRLGAGPRSLERPADAVVAADGADLARLVAAPDGPREIWLEPRVYKGDLSIARPVALRGAMGAVLEGTGAGTVLEIAADGVTVDNLTIRRSGRKYTSEDSGLKAKGHDVAIQHVLVEDTLFGISLQSCERCSIDHAHVVGTGGDHGMRGDGVKLWESHDSAVRFSFIENARDMVVWYSRRALLEGNVVRDGRYGTHFMYAHDAVVKGSRLVDNVVGIFVMYSARLRVEGNVLAGAHGAAGVGIGFKESDGVHLSDNWLVANTTGAYLDRTPRTASDPVTFERNVFALNQVGLRLHSSQEGVEMAGNDFRDNAVVVEVEGGGDALGIGFSKNRWSDYAGYDLDGDGRGDVPFEIKALSSDLKELHPALRFFEGTAALSLVDAIAQAIPVLSAKKLLVDRSPAFVLPEVQVP